MTLLLALANAVLSYKAEEKGLIEFPAHVIWGAYFFLILASVVFRQLRGKWLTPTLATRQTDSGSPLKYSSAGWLLVVIFLFYFFWILSELSPGSRHA
jgi:hypothetical protein